MRKNLLLIAFLGFSITNYSGGLPKSAFGDYTGEMEAYSIMKNDIEMEIEKHTVNLSINDEEISYESGTIKMKGTYEAIKKEKNEYLIKASFSNGKSVILDMEFKLNKKNKTILVTGKNGQPDVLLDLLEG
jgi:hypothetical protein